MAAHAPEVYLAALEALGDGSRLATVRSQYGYLTCDGDVSVSVIDSDGNEFVPKVDDKRQGRDGARMVVQYGRGREQSLLYSPQERYAVTFAAEEDETISLACGVIDSEVATDVRRSEYNNVKLAEGERLVLVIGQEGSALYRVTAENLAAVLTAVQNGGRPDATVATSVKADKQFGEAEETPVTPTPEPTISAEPTAEPEATISPEATVSPEPTSSPEPTATPEPSNKPDEKSGKPLWRILAVVVGIIAVLEIAMLIRRRGRA